MSRPDVVRSKCVLSKKSTHRYWLERHMVKKPKKFVAFCMLNPSEAEEEVADATDTRTLLFAQEWGFDATILVNLFAARNKNPSFLKSHRKPVGRHNNRFILKAAKKADLIVCAWGNDGLLFNRQHEVLSLLQEHNLFALHINKNGTPKHPLYCKKDAALKIWKASR